MSHKDEERGQHNEWLVISRTGDDWWLFFYQGRCGIFGKLQAKTMFEDLLKAKEKGLVDEVFFCQNVGGEGAPWHQGDVWNGE